MLSFFAEASNTTLVLVLSLAILTTMKCARKVPSFVISTCLMYSLSDITLWFPHKLYMLLVSCRVAFLYRVIFFLHHCNYSINTCLDFSSIEWLLHTVDHNVLCFFIPLRAILSSRLIISFSTLTEISSTFQNFMVLPSILPCSPSVKLK